MTAGAVKQLAFNQGSGAMLVRICRHPRHHLCSARVDRYVMVWHTRSTFRKTGAWPQHAHYENFVLTFQAYPPFAVDAVLPMVPSDACLASMSGAEGLVYVSSLEVIADLWHETPAGLTASTSNASALIGFGTDNRRSWVLRVPFLDLLSGHPLLRTPSGASPESQTARPVAPPDRRVRS